ncbi:hypothetical protein TIFTF001_015261 [Ficus carica]|uniref:Uncharacterized protein n=1 Tax=Ficus carica TaxID=3494 RepID=A0AA88D8S8_FICCA|nr:hypothetical protein TIFTF001_015261 [Ficus carica]
MPKISGTTSDVIARSDRSCIVTLWRVTCKREAPRSDGDTGGASVIDTRMLKRYESNRLVPRVHGLVSGDTRAMRQMSSGGLSVVTRRRRQHVRGTTYEGRPVWVNNTIPGYCLTWAHGRSRRHGKIWSGNAVPREESSERIELGQWCSVSAGGCNFTTFTWSVHSWKKDFVVGSNYTINTNRAYLNAIFDMYLIS